MTAIVFDFEDINQRMSRRAAIEPVTVSEPQDMGSWRVIYAQMLHDMMMDDSVSDTLLYGQSFTLVTPDGYVSIPLAEVHQIAGSLLINDGDGGTIL